MESVAVQGNLEARMQDRGVQFSQPDSRSGDGPAAADRASSLLSLRASDKETQIWNGTGR